MLTLDVREAGLTARPESDGRRAKKRAIVIGSGLGGLAAAVRLGAKGYAVTVLEKLDQPGGRARVFRQDGYTFDAGPTIITAPFLLEELWALCGKRMADDIDLRAMDPFYNIRFDDGQVFACSANTEAMRAQIARFAPGDVAGYDRYLEASRRAYDIGFMRMGTVHFASFATFLKHIPDVLSLSGHQSVYAFVSRYFKDPRIRTVFSFHPLLIGGNPYSVTSIYCLIAHLERTYGVHSAIGGTAAIVDGLVRLIEGQGGTVRLNAEVREILSKDGAAVGVRLANGETMQASQIVCNADATWAYDNLIPGRRRRWTASKTKTSDYSMGLFVWYFGTDRRYDSLPHHSILLGPRYGELLKDIFRRKKLAPDFSLYLHRPTATDPNLAPPGGDAFYALCPVPNLDSGTDWTIESERRRAAVQARLEATVLPDLGKHVVTSKIMNPLHFRDELNSTKGAGFSLEPLLWQSAWFRPHNRSEELRNLYMVGAGTHPGAGVPGVLTSAQLLDQLVPHAT
jgi:phytoene desaturase